MEWNGSCCVSGQYERCPSPVTEIILFLVCSVGPIGMNFDAISASSPVPNGFQAFQWSNLRECFLASEHRACNNDMNPVSFTRNNGTFLLKRLNHGVWISTINATFIGKHLGVVIYNQTLTMNIFTGKMLSFNWKNIDTIVVQSSPQSQPSAMSLNRICRLVGQDDEHCLSWSVKKKENDGSIVFLF